MFKICITLVFFAMAIFFRGETSDLDCSSTAELHICNSPRWLLSLRTIGSNQTSYFSCLYLTCHFGSIKTICFSCESFIYLFWWQNKLRRVFLFIYLFIYFWLCWASFLCEGFLQLRQVGATLHRSARASHYRGLSCCGAQSPDTQAQ